MRDTNFYEHDLGGSKQCRQKLTLSLGASILDRLEIFVTRFITYPSVHARVAHLLWIVHTHLMTSWESTPRIAFLSAERGSGKTRALEVTELLVPQPVHAVNVTPAYLIRKVGEDPLPTILYDEVDTLFGSRMQDTGEIRGLLNAGHRRGAVAGRCVVIGKNVHTEEFPAYCAVALAGIGRLPDTVASRCILIQMRRRAPDEFIEPYRPRLHAPEAAAIYDLVAQWCSEIASYMQLARPEIPQGVEDRNADCWEPLLAIADAAGGEWPRRARAAALNLIASSAEQTQTTRVQLLSDLYDVFRGHEKRWTEDILKELHALPESAWADVRGKPLSDRGLAAILRKYGVKSKDVRIGGEVRKGYVVDDLHDPWKRYVLPIRQERLQALQGLQTGCTTEGDSPKAEGNCPFVADVADVALPRGEEGRQGADRLAYDTALTRPEAEARTWTCGEVPTKFNKSL
jgi:hypothetical protein